jgi:enoyl-CoA hydratase/carnithine racemase
LIGGSSAGDQVARHRERIRIVAAPRAVAVDTHVDHDAVTPETRKTFGDVSVWPSGDLVATVEIGRPPDNFFDAGLITSLADACAWLDGRPEFRAAVLCSDGRHFCAGANFTERSGRPVMGTAKDLYAAAARLFEARTPVVGSWRTNRRSPRYGG